VYYVYGPFINFIFLKNPYEFIYFIGLKLKCGIRACFGFRGTPFLLKVWLGLNKSSLSWVCDRPRFSGIFAMVIHMLKDNVEQL
jgi:hypothetical protein